MIMVSASGCQPRRGGRFWRVVAVREGRNSLSQTRDNSFGKKYRLNQDLLIRKVLRRGERRVSASFRFHRLSLPSGNSCFCLKTPAKIGKAVVRNRLKRRLREFLRTHKQLWPKQTAHVIIPRKEALQLTHDQLAAELTSYFKA